MGCVRDDGTITPLRRRWRLEQERRTLGQPRWGWRTELDDQADGALRIRMFDVTPAGEESIGVEIDLAREDRR